MYPDNQISVNLIPVTVGNAQDRGVSRWRLTLVKPRYPSISLQVMEFPVCPPGALSVHGLHERRSVPFRCLLQGIVGVMGYGAVVWVWV